MPIDNSKADSLSPNIEAIEIDETSYCDADELEKYGVRKVFAKYVYDKNCCTYLCSAQPCYTMYLVGTFPEFHEDKASEEDMEEFRDLLLEGDVYSDDITYMSRYSVDDMSDDANREAVDLGEVRTYAEYSDDEYSDLMFEARDAVASGDY